ncbi:hypothetical protein [Glycomyces arizonensis]|uniref:hypothetical protein n=1 Tax=Glycomyces arizonensis TaxID=256035 RepID=UPI000411139A|nr:hypothetical protein [Glycomyces arizonensis]
MTPHTPPESTPHDTTHNVAESGAMVGVQGRVIHNVTVYQVPADATPRQKYEYGLRFLNDGVPFKAERLINDAMAAGLDDAEVRFHWVLALFSKRSYRDLDRFERGRLDKLAENICAYPEGKHRSALEAISELISYLGGNGGSVNAAEKKILALEPDLLALVQRHLQNVLSGATQDKLWEEARRRAEGGRTEGDRLGRVWAYFHPEPIPARVGRVEAPWVSPLDKPYAATASLLFALAVGYLGWLLLASGDVVAMLAYPVAIAAGCVGVREAFEWRYRTDRIKLEDRRNFSRPAAGDLRGNGFAKKVGRDFEYYFAKYRPYGMDYTVWLSETAGVRGRLREEVAEIYRERRIPIGRVRWLIGYLAKDVRRRSSAGTLYEYRERFRVPLAMQGKCVLALTITLITAFDVVVAAVPVAPLAGSAVVVGVCLSGLYALRQWKHILSEERRYEDDKADAEQRKRERDDAYLRWKNKLDSIRPSESEMEAWLNCDKTILIDKALRQYRVSWSDVLAHAVLHGHGARAKAGRAKGGPWRYSKYDLRLFLITADGVREVSSVLHFEEAVFDGQERNNYRFDALSSVHVADKAAAGHVLKLTLTNGPARNINVTDVSAMEPQQEEAMQSDVDDLPENFLEMSLSAAGFEHALRILEGIAAEGKGWIDRDDFARRTPG